MKIALGMPTESGRPHNLARAQAENQLRGRGGLLRSIQRKPVTLARNEIVRWFLATDATHLFFVDDDTVLPSDALDMLLLHMPEYPIVVGVVPTWWKDAICWNVVPRERTELLSLNDLPTAPFEILIAGLACCLIARPIFEKLDFPWFRWQEANDGKYLGEDFDFFARVMEPRLCDPRVKCGHIKEVDLLRVAELCSTP